MRVALWRRLAFGLLLIPLIGMGAVAQLPPLPGEPRPVTFPPANPSEPEKLKADIASLAAERKGATEDSLGAERMRLRAELLAVLKRMETLSLNPAPPVRPPQPGPKSKSYDPIEGTKAVDTLRRAMNLFRDDDFEAALAVFRQLGQDLPQLTREDRVFVRYMTASCLRRLNRLSEAQAAYREAADMSQDDEFFAESAVWQLSLMRTNQDLETQLSQLRARAKQK